MTGNNLVENNALTDSPPVNPNKKCKNSEVKNLADNVVEKRNKTNLNCAVFDEENVSAADVLYNRLRKIKDQKRKNDFKHRVCDILYLSD